MINLKNISVGFLVSFVGSIPLGYLNVVGYEIYLQQGFTTTICYLLGVILIEFFVIYFSLIFANQLASNAKLDKKNYRLIKIILASSSRIIEVVSDVTGTVETTSGVKQSTSLPTTAKPKA